MTPDEKIELHHQIRQIENSVTAMNGPYMETGQILKQLECLREAWIDDEIETCCYCGAQHLLSQDEMTMSEDGWACPRCAYGEEDTPQ
ncbi:MULTISPECIES: hypothetical protein [unclassified Mameliella]|uniref:hypothetical protein n=1 Tax=unclassified Mameliella TaxID=2630630 RepID=UPI00273DD2AD|nr:MULTISPECIES: hypothetical protein [unclassified Mameliella]